MLLMPMIGLRGPGRYLAQTPGGGGQGESDGGFVEPPVVTTTATGDVTVKGRVKPGSFGKFVVPLATVQAGRQYTFRYTPGFSGLAQQGRLAMVGIGFKNGNDFHITGLRGDGSTGLHRYRVYGTPPNGWNKDTGHTTVDGGASTNGTQAGPNYIRVVISQDGTTYTLKTSGDSGASYVDEITDASLSPFTNVSGVITFGLALWFSNADAGPFTIQIDQFADAAAPVGPVVTFLGTFTDIVTIDPQTQTIDVGAAGNKIVVICPHSARAAAGQRTISSVSIDGTNGTIAGQNGINDGVNEGTQTGIAYREISTGGNISVIVDWSSTHSFSAFDAYTITGYSTNVHSDVKTATGNDPTISTLAVGNSGVVIVAASGVEPSTGAFTLSNVTLDHDQQCVGTSASMREASGHTSVAAATTSFTTQASSASGFEVVVAVSFAGGSLTPTANNHLFDANPSSTAAIPIGAVANDRVTVFAFAIQNIGTAANISSVTCGGNAMTRRVRDTATPGDRHAEIWEIDSGTGSPLASATTAVFTVTMSTGNLGIVYQVYRVTGSAVGGGSGSSTTTGTTSVTITVPSGGAAIVACNTTSTNAGSLSNITEDVNAAETSSNNQRGIIGSTITAGSLTSTYSGTGTSPVMVAASYKAP